MPLWSNQETPCLTVVLVLPRCCPTAAVLPTPNSVRAPKIWFHSQICSGSKIVWVISDSVRPLSGKTCLQLRVHHDAHMHLPTKCMWAVIFRKNTHFWLAQAESHISKMVPIIMIIGAGMLKKCTDHRWKLFCNPTHKGRSASWHGESPHASMLCTSLFIHCVVWN